jgi:hypothetical protein
VNPQGREAELRGVRRCSAPENGARGVAFPVSPESEPLSNGDRIPVRGTGQNGSTMARMTIATISSVGSSFIIR